MSAMKTRARTILAAIVALLIAGPGLAQSPPQKPPPPTPGGVRVPAPFDQLGIDRSDEDGFLKRRSDTDRPGNQSSSGITDEPVPGTSRRSHTDSLSDAPSPGTGRYQSSTGLTDVEKPGMGNPPVQTYSGHRRRR